MAAIRAINSSITRPLWGLRPPPARMDAAVGVADAFLSWNSMLAQLAGAAERHVASQESLQPLEYHP